jgi:hypothetical protein
VILSGIADKITIISMRYMIFFGVSAGCFWCPAPHRRPPIYAFNQHRKLRRGQRDRAILGLWPNKLATFNAFVPQSEMQVFRRPRRTLLQ